MDQLTHPSIVPAGPGGGARLLEGVRGFAASLDQWPGALYQLDEGELGEVVSTMLTIAERTTNVAALATADAFTRGTVANSTATGAPAWVKRQAPGVDPAVVRRVGASVRSAPILVTSSFVSAWLPVPPRSPWRPWRCVKYPGR